MHGASGRKGQALHFPGFGGILAVDLGDQLVAFLIMNTPDISQTPLVRRYGLRGASLFARLWFPLLYLALVGLGATQWFVGQDVVKGWRRVFIGCLSAALVVTAASILTRMRLQYLAGIEMLKHRLGQRSGG